MSGTVKNILTEGPVAETCPAVGYQKVNMCVPVTVTSFANAMTTVTKCCGEPVIVSGEEPCKGVKNGVCKFTISRGICIAVPVDFGATATVGDTYADCPGADTTDICTNCVDEEVIGQ